MGPLARARAATGMLGEDWNLAGSDAQTVALRQGPWLSPLSESQC